VAQPLILAAEAEAAEIVLKTTPVEVARVEAGAGMAVLMAKNTEVQEALLARRVEMEMVIHQNHTFPDQAAAVVVPAAVILPN